MDDSVLSLVVQGDEKKVVALACADCGIVYGLTRSEAAEQCCKPNHCSVCGEQVEQKYRTKCWDCVKTERNNRILERFHSAEKVEWDESAGPMLYDEENDIFIRDLDDVDLYGTRFAYTTTPRRLRIMADDIVINALEDEHYDEAYDDIANSEIKELQDMLDQWCDKVGIVSYVPDYRRVVVFKHPEEET